MADQFTPNGFHPTEEDQAAERVERYIADLHAGRHAMPPTDATPAEAEAMQMAARLHTASEVAAGPRDAFVNDLRARLERDLFPTAAVTPPAAPQVPPQQSPPPPATRQGRAGASRRALLRGGLAAAGGLAAGLAGGALLGEAIAAAQNTGPWDVALVDNGTWQTVAQATQVSPGSVQRFTTDQLVGHLVRYQDGSFAAYSAACTHMGCILAWNATQHTFDCPCHNGHFNDHGQFVSGAVAYRPLPQIQTRVVGDEVQVLVPTPSTPAATPTDGPGYGH
jgi:Rieske Fe-S protein